MVRGKKMVVVVVVGGIESSSMVGWGLEIFGDNC
jgi:hypothetical protein